MKKGEIYYAHLGRTVGSEQGGFRLVCVVQNDIGNTFSQTIIVVPLTSQIKPNLPTHLLINGTPKESILLCEQLRTIDKGRIKDELIYNLDSKELEELNNCLRISLGI
ncbi:MAG: type II toxin-antitoxin system PemK/MazF family toxin [Clostridia bacterium]